MSLDKKIELLTELRELHNVNICNAETKNVIGGDELYSYECALAKLMTDPIFEHKRTCNVCGVEIPENSILSLCDKCLLEGK